MLRGYNEFDQQAHKNDFCQRDIIDGYSKSFLQILAIENCRSLGFKRNHNINYKSKPFINEASQSISDISTNSRFADVEEVNKLKQELFDEHKSSRNRVSNENSMRLCQVNHKVITIFIDNEEYIYTRSF